MRNAAIVVLMLFVTVPVFGDQAPPDPKLTARFGALRPAQVKDPYGNLFKAQQELNKALAKAEVTMKPTIVCGMLVVPVDPKLDPKMGITPKQDGIDFTMRAIEPPVCHPAK
jgi:hypothetical protein